MRILYLERVDKKCNYYEDMKHYLGKYSQLKVYFSKKDNNFQEVMATFQPHLIILGFSISDFRGNPDFYLKVKVPVYVILNKEYQNLEDKLDWLKRLKPRRVFTVHHDFKKYQELTKIPFHRIMWSANEKIFKKYDEEYKYDFFFSGVIREEQTQNLRQQVYDSLSELQDYRLLIKVAFFKNNKLEGELYQYSNEEYAKLINDSKIVLSTTGPGDLIGTRYFEIMASNKALILCNKMPDNIYDKYLIDGFNCVMFTDMKNFKEKFIYYLENEDERMKIVEQAYHYFQNNLKWDHSIKRLISLLK